MAYGGFYINKWTPPRNSGGIPYGSTRFSLSMEIISRLTRDGTAEPVSRYQILRHARKQGNAHFPCSADHEQDWRPYLVDPDSAIICDDHTYIIHTYTECGRCYAFGCMVAIRGGYRMDRGWHYAKLSLSNGLRLSFSGMYVCVYFVILVPFSLSFFVCLCFSFPLIGAW